MVATAYRKPPLQRRSGGFRFTDNRALNLLVKPSFAAVPEFAQDDQEVFYGDEGIEVDVGDSPR